jgi:hypothetical protein
VDPDPIRVRIERKNTAENMSSFKIAIYLSLGLHIGRPSYRRSLQPSKVNIQQHFKNGSLVTFTLVYFFGSFFALLDPDPDCDSGSGYGSSDPIESGSNSDPDPKHCGM